MAVLTGCSVDTLIWGSEGAKVIQMTEKLVSDLALGEASEIVCMISVADLGEPSDWLGLSAVEPEKVCRGVLGRPSGA